MTNPNSMNAKELTRQMREYRERLEAAMFLQGRNGPGDMEAAARLLPVDEREMTATEVREKIAALPRYDLAGDYYEPIWRLDPADDGEYLSRDEVLALFGGGNE